MKNFLVIKHDTFSDFFHSVIKTESLDDASTKFIASNDYEASMAYSVYPLVNYTFNENYRVSVPENTPSSFVFTVQTGNDEHYKQDGITNRA